MIYFTSDLHFGHANIIRLCKRPFADVDEMDGALITNWNKKVTKKDIVYILGDVVWDKNKVGFYMEQLKGKKILVCGNHDSTWCKKEETKGFFEQVTSFMEINAEGRCLTLCHYPMLEWKNSRESDGKIGYHLHGHIHNRVAQEYKPLYMQFNALNVGVDVNGFVPVTFEEALQNNLRFKLSALSDEEGEILKEACQRFAGQK